MPVLGAVTQVACVNDVATTSSFEKSIAVTVMTFETITWYLSSCLLRGGVLGVNHRTFGPQHSRQLNTFVLRRSVDNWTLSIHILGTSHFIAVQVPSLEMPLKFDTSLLDILQFILRVRVTTYFVWRFQPLTYVHFKNVRKDTAQNLFRARFGGDVVDFSRNEWF